MHKYLHSNHSVTIDHAENTKIFTHKKSYAAIENQLNIIFINYKYIGNIFHLPLCT